MKNFFFSVLVAVALGVTMWFTSTSGRGACCKIGCPNCPNGNCCLK